MFGLSTPRESSMNKIIQLLRDNGFEVDDSGIIVSIKDQDGVVYLLEQWTMSNRTLESDLIEDR
jgi:hypothetical protein